MDRPFALFHNPLALPEAPYGPAQETIMNAAGHQAAFAEITQWPGYAPTPLLALDDIAREVGVAAVHYKDEAGRFGLGSFKALGGPYAVRRHLGAVLDATLGRAVATAELLDGRHRALTEGVTVTTATDGNHGRAVAWAAALFGCRAVIYLHHGVSPGRQAAIERYGATVVRTPGHYDDSVRRAAADAAANGWTVVSDTSYEGYREIPRDVMHGYTVMVEEALGQWPGAEPATHVFVQGGVGALAAAVAARLWQRARQGRSAASANKDKRGGCEARARVPMALAGAAPPAALGTRRPRIVVVEPERAACLFASARAGTPTAATGDLDTVMAGLACAEVSRLAWDMLARAADDFMTVPDQAAIDAMRRLAARRQPVVAGESAVAGLAAVRAVAADGAARAALRLGADSRVLLFGSEGATDPALYTGLVGRSPESLAQALTMGGQG
ncbi:MAG: diaminopropionate ammonia-lyase [Proteobacteria bacterium]|nr:diaminopropionate ammonia-lyase [Pseudomonadota bacterium]